MDDVRRLSQWATGGLRPDLTVLLDVDPELGLERARAAGHGRDRVERESLEFHQRVRDGFLALADAAPDHYLIVDAGGHPETVATLIRIATAKRLASRVGAPPPVGATAAERPGKSPRWRVRRARSRHGATVAPVPPTATPVPPVGAASTPADEVPENAR
jgi:dTMP kinase